MRGKEQKIQIIDLYISFLFLIIKTKKKKTITVENIIKKEEKHYHF